MKRVCDVREVKQSWWRLFYHERALNLLDEADASPTRSHIAEINIGRQGSAAGCAAGPARTVELKEEKLELVSLRHGQNAVSMPCWIARRKRRANTGGAEFKSPVIVESCFAGQGRQIVPRTRRTPQDAGCGACQSRFGEKGFESLTSPLGAFHHVRQKTPETG